MAKQKKISSPATEQELNHWLQKQLEATTLHSGGSYDQDLDPEDPFYNDALEGLEKFDSTAEIYKQTAAINRNLKGKINGGRKKNQLDSAGLFWYIIAIILILILVIVAFIVLRMRMGQI